MCQYYKLTLGKLTNILVVNFTEGHLDFKKKLH